MAYGRYMVHIWFLNHCGHGLFDRSNFEFVVCVFGPDFLQVEVWPVQVTLEEGEGTGMRYTGSGVFEVGVTGDDEAWGDYVGVDVVGTIGSGCFGTRDVCECWSIG